MTKPNTCAQRQSVRKPTVFAPPSRPKALAAAVSLAVMAPHAMAGWGNQVEAWVRPGTERSYGGLEGVLPFSQSGNSLTFADLKFKLGQSGTYEGNLGVGHRFLTGSGDWALGFYGAWDHRRSTNGNSFNQITGGAEARSDKLDFRFNYYWPITDRERLGLGSNYNFEDFHIYQSGIWEEAMKGYDIEAGVLLPFTGKWETRAYAAYYSFEGKDIAPQTDGWRVRVEVRPTHNFAIGLSHQQDDMFKDQTSLELRYIFGKDSKSGVRSLRDRMTDPWTRDIDVVVSTPQEGFGSKFGEAVPGIDVIHIDNSRVVNGDGSFENPYNTVVSCNVDKCPQGVVNPDDAATYNVIRLWEGNSQTGGMEYTPISLYNGQMLAGEPVSAAMIVGQFHPGMPGAIDVPWNLDLSTAPVINGNSPAIALVSGNNRIMGVSTINGGIHSGSFDYYSNFVSGYVSGFVDIRNNSIDASTYSGGTGISLSNYNGSLNAMTPRGGYGVIIGYNQINAARTGIELYNVANDGGSAFMSASIFGNDIDVDSSNYYTGATGVILVNAANYDAYARQNADLRYNTITANGVSSADGVAAINVARNYSSAYQDVSLYGNTITAHDTAGMDSSTGVTLVNAAVYGAYAYQDADLWYNTITATSDNGNATGVLAYNVATGGYDATYGGDAEARQYVSMYGDTITATGGNDAAGVALYNFAYSGAGGVNDYYLGYINLGGDATAFQSVSMNGVTVSASATNGNAYGVLIENRAEATYASTANANQNVYIYNSVGDGQAGISATSSIGDAFGVSIRNEAVAQYYTGNYAQAGQNVWMGNNDISADAPSGNAYGVHAENISNVYSNNDFADGSQYVNLGSNNSISATAKYNAYGVQAINTSTAQNDYDYSFAGQTLSIGSNNSITATATATYSTAVGVDARNNVYANGYESYAEGRQTVTIGDNNSISATAVDSATGINLRNNIQANDYYAFADGGQIVTIGGDYWYGGNTITATATGSYGSARGINARNSVNTYDKYSTADGSQTIAIANYNTITATAVDSATGIKLRNRVESYGYNSGAFGYQSLDMGYRNTVSATASASSGDADGLYAYNEVLANGDGSTAWGSQNLTTGSYNTFLGTATGAYGHADAVDAENDVEANDWYSEAEGYQDIVFGSYNTFTAVANGTNGSTHGITLYNDIDAEDDNSSAYGSQSLTLGSNASISATSNGNGANAYAIALKAENNVQSDDDFAPGIGYQTVTLGSNATITATASGTYGEATGVHLYNYAYTQQENDNSAIANQSFTLGAGSSITATGNADAIGLYAYNFVYADGGSAQGTQIVDINGTALSPVSITATSASGDAYGLALYNSLESESNDGSAAAQTVTVSDSSITATGYNGSLAVLADNYNHAYYNAETATQTVVIDDSVLRSSVGDAIYAYNVTDVYSPNSGTGTQTLVVTGSSLYGGTSGSAQGIEMVNSGVYRSFQNGVIVGNYISSSNHGVAIYNSGGYFQHVLVSATVINAGGLDTYADGGGFDQLLTVTP